MAQKENNKSGLYIIIGIAVVVGAIYFVSSSSLFARSKDNPNDTASDAGGTDTYACPFLSGQSGSDCSLASSSGTTESSDLGITTESTDLDITPAPTLTSTSAPAPITAQPQNPAYETVNVGHTAFALNPEVVTLSAGGNYRLIITPTENGGGCMSTMTIPGIDENIYTVRKGVSIIISIDNAQAGSYDVICGAMGMYQGTIIIQ